MERNCPACGTALGPQDHHCPNCGAIPPAMQPDSGTAAPRVEHPMKWFKFIIYFQLFFSALTNVISGVGYLTGNIYATQGLTGDQVYSVLPGLRPVDLIMGAALIVLAVLAIVVRQKLAHYSQGAPAQYLLLLGANVVVPILYMAVASVVLGELLMDATTVGSLVGNLIMIGINKVYFDKRAELFVS